MTVSVRATTPVNSKDPAFRAQWGPYEPSLGAERGTQAQKKTPLYVCGRHRDMSLRTLLVSKHSEDKRGGFGGGGTMTHPLFLLKSQSFWVSMVVGGRLRRKMG